MKCSKCNQPNATCWVNKKRYCQRCWRKLKASKHGKGVTRSGRLSTLGSLIRNKNSRKVVKF